MTTIHPEQDDDLDLGQDDHEPTFAEQLSKMGINQLRQETTKRGLSGIGNTVTLINRLVDYENNDGMIPDPAAPSTHGGLKPGIAPAPVEPTAAQAAQAAQIPPAAGIAVSASAAPAAGDPVHETSRAARQRTGFFPHTNTFRAEFPIGGVVGSVDPPDDNSHFRMLAQAHEMARESGYVSLGAPDAGKRVGFASLQIPGQGPMRSVIYEVFAREVEE